MGQKLVIGPINRGLRTDREPFVIDNDSFPTLVNAYQWRGRIKRKRGTSFLSRLQRYLETTSGSGNLSITIAPGNLVAGNTVITIGSDTFTDSGTAANPTTLLSSNVSASGTLNRTTGALSITGSQIITAVNYYPGLPVMGIEDFYNPANDFLNTVSFDTKYAYQISNSSPYPSYSVSFYKNPPTATYSGYTAKSTWTPINWNGQNYQQFWTSNYQGSMWTTNGITIPFATTNIGMQFKTIVTVTVLTATTATLQITGHGLVVGDFVFVNEVSTTTGINFQTGFVTTVTDANNVVVTFPSASIASDGTGGIAQYLTNSSDSTKDCIRWYDGDPTEGSPPTPTGSKGWVNFMPPLSQASFSISDLPSKQYYLVGARLVVPFKDRLVFFGVVVQASTGNPIYLQDTIVYSQNGTPYYTSSFTGSPVSASTTFSPILVPANQTATAPAYFADQTGFGGFQQVGVDQPITTVSSNQDVLIVGFSELQARMIYTGNDIVPFNFYVINSELGSSSTFSVVNMDSGVITRGSRGFVITSQNGAQRVDLQIPDIVFGINLVQNGRERFCAQRDFINEWVYFTYPDAANTQFFPNKTLQYNYRDDSWGVFYESYTTYGSFRKQTGNTWSSLSSTLTWNSWTTPWNEQEEPVLLQSQVIGGTAQGFVMAREEETQEGVSIFISNIDASTSTVTAPNHMLNNGDYIIISGALGTISSQVNSLIFSVRSVAQNSFILNPPLDNTGSPTYLGGGLIQRMYIPFIQSKQFPLGWDLARKTRLGAQQYLFTKTANGQITLLIFLSEDAQNAYNTISSVLPQIPNNPGIDVSGVNSSGVLYSTVLYTCPESTNLGLTDITSNLNTPTAPSQQQIWHRMNTSLIGDTVQFGFILSDAQMRDTTLKNQFSEIELQAAILDVNQSQLLC